MPHFKEALIFGAFVFLFYSVFEFLRKKNSIFERIPKPFIGAASGLCALAFVKLYLLNN
ncbi:hypothetical protein D3C87_994840 [compost metagenome]|nr:hypothetical protein [Agrobacterium tumefaciens]MBP2518650.1 hypothetical protein [Agrobacterium tumefaciens]MBP2578002.1 hypothetical protein [Agrobacterium tumefaciens]MBP2595948.1 hypothetical protein [Agrobacterium tumefaciens]